MAADTDADGPSQSSGLEKAKRQKSPYIGNCPASRLSCSDLQMSPESVTRLPVCRIHLRLRRAERQRFSVGMTILRTDG